MSLQRLRFYSHKKFLPESSMGHVHFLFPWWGANVEDIYRGQGVYDNYLASAGDWYEPVDQLEQADFAVLPANYKYYKKAGRIDLLEDLIAQCRSLGKKVLIFFKDDSDEELQFDTRCTIVFRTSFYQTRRKSNEHAMPVWSGDLISIYNNNEFTPSGLGPKVKIGFCGQTISNSRFLSRLGKVVIFRLSLFALSLELTSAKNFGKRWFSFLRWFALQRLMRADAFLCSFIERYQYLGGAWIKKGSFNLDVYGNIRQEYISNIRNNDLFPCARGGGNYSMRFYEVLSFGKIPIWIDTDDVLPFPDLIDWRQHIIHVPVRQVARIDKIVADAVRDLTDIKFQAWQGRNRNLWRNYLSPEGFFRNMAFTIRNSL